MSELIEPEHESKRLQREVAVFSDIARAMTSSFNLDEVLQIIMDRVVEFFRPTTWSLLRLDDRRNELYVAKAVANDTVEALRTLRIKVGEGINGWVAEYGEPIIIPNVYNEPRFAARLDEMAKWKTKSIVCMPLQSRDRVLGVIQLINCPKECFSEHELIFLHALCDYAAIAIDYRRNG